MNQLIVYAIGVLLFSGTYMVLSYRFWRVIIGTAFLSHAANLVLLSSGGYFPGAHPPILNGAEQYIDPLPQALILTAIVISFGVTAFALIVLHQVYQTTGTTDLGELEKQEWRGHGEETEDDHE
jgi:multicomponent Na+:H+ antiporter subunit C